MRRTRRVGLLGAAALAILGLSGCERWNSDLVSVNGNGTGSGNAPSGGVISPDGTKVAFTTRASNLGPTDTTLCTMPYEPIVTRPCDDVYVRDLMTGTTTLVSQNAAGTNSGNFDSSGAVFSPDGTKVAFSSQANDLTSPATIGHSTRIYVRDLTTGALTYISNDVAMSLRFDPTGTKVVFTTFNGNLGPTDTNGNSDVYIKDLTTGAVELVSVNQAGTDSGVYASSGGEFTPDGTKVTFISVSSFGQQDTNFAYDVFVRDLVSDTTRLVTGNASGTGTANGGVSQLDYSPDGTKVAFYTDATDLGVADPNLRGVDLYVRDVNTLQTLRVPARVPSGLDGTQGLPQVVFSPDSRKVAYVTWTMIDGTGTEVDGGPASVYVLDLDTGQARDVSGPPTGANGPAWWPCFGPDSNLVVFQSAADDVVPNDANGERDIFATDLTKTGLAASIISAADDGGPANGMSRFPSCSTTSDRALIAFASEASNLDPLDTNTHRDVFVAEWKDPDA